MRAIQMLAVVALISSCGTSGSGGDAGGGFAGGEDGDGDGSSTGDLTIKGVVMARVQGEAPVPLSGATLRVSCDRDGDGKIGSDEASTGTADSLGQLSVRIACPSGKPLVARASANGYATGYSGPLPFSDSGTLTTNITLTEAEPFTCTTESCVTTSGRMTVSGLGQRAKGFGKVFNPSFEGDLMPGGFRDDLGQLLISGVFAIVELETIDGEKIERLSAPATLRMEVPYDTWNVMADVKAGNGRIDVPMYAFDEAKGSWVREGSGHLEDIDGKTVPESALAAIRQRSFKGALVARADVTHFSAWNVDWPAAEKPGCMLAKLARPGGEGVMGTIIVQGLTYEGGVPSQLALADGTVCVPLMRSEGPRDDFDLDGAKGEKHRVRVLAQFEGKTYNLGEFEALAGEGTCGGSGCLDVGTLTLDEEHELKAGLCTITGTFSSVTGKPWPNGPSVVVYDWTLSDEEADTCRGDCELSTVATTNGTFSIRTLVKGEVVIAASGSLSGGSNKVSEDAWRWSFGCPTAPIHMRSDQGAMALTLIMKLSNKVITWSSPWTKNPLASTVYVVRGIEEIWRIESENGSTISSPLTYGTVPSGAVQKVPASGSPPPLKAGDQIVVLGDFQEGIFAISVDGSFEVQ